MSAALQQVIATIDQEIAKLQTARAVVAGLVLPFQQPTVSLEGAWLPPSGPAVTRAMADAMKAMDQVRRPVATNGGDSVRPEQPAASSQQPAAEPRPRKPSVIRAPAMPTLKGWKKVELTPEQIATIRAGAKAERAISQIARETGLSDYIVKTRIATMQMEGQL